MHQTPLLNLIVDLQKRGRAVCPQLAVDAVVDAIARGWGDQLLARVEDVARNGAAIVDLQAAAQIIRDHNLTCTVRECARALLQFCSEHVYGPANWRAE